MRALIVPLVLVSSLVQVAQAGPLNDTGMTQCISGGSLGTCTNATTGDSAPEPRQDGRFGRDAAAGKSQLTKTGGGAAGFDFTPLDSAGNAIAVVAGVPASPPACVYDNVTHLTWEVKTPANKDDTYTWNATAVHAATANGGAGLCGHTDWRLPTRRELLSIAYFGTSSPAIDIDYFPNTVSSWYWTSDAYAPDPTFAWFVYFHDGHSGAYGKTNGSYVRLVREEE